MSVIGRRAIRITGRRLVAGAGATGGRGCGRHARSRVRQRLDGPLNDAHLRSQLGNRLDGALDRHHLRDEVGRDLTILALDECRDLLEEYH
jgi:hypothetical protein